MDPKSRRTLNEDLARLADGDRTAARAVFDALWPPVRRFCTAALRDETRAEDTAQEALMKLFASAHRFDAERDALAWAIELAAWEIRTARKKVARTREDPGPLDLARADASPNAADVLETKEIQAKLDIAFDVLSPSDRDVIRAVLDGRVEPGATWRKRKERAIARLRAAWRSIHAAD